MTEQAFTIEQFASAFKVGRTVAFEEIRTGRIASYKVGRRRYISARAAAEWQARMEAETAGELNGGMQAIAAPSELRP